MRRTALCLAAVLAATSIYGCAGGSSSREITTTNSNSGVSFGIYDLSSGQSSATANTAVSSNGDLNFQRKTGGGGGGGGGLNQTAPQQNATLNDEQIRQSATAFDRKIIRNAELDVESDTPEQAQQNITSIAESKGGFVVETQQTSSDSRSATRDIVTMSIRVPSERFADTLDEIHRSAGRLVSESVKGQDVTEEFIDIEAQLKAKKALEAQFMEIMKRANTVEDALNVNGQLADVRAEIERIEGRKRFLENQASLSTIKLRIQTPRVFAANSAGFGERLANAFGNGLDAALNFVLGLITLLIAVLPAAIVIGLPGFIAIRYFWKRQARPRSIAEIAEDEISNG